jgi:hypothetical protein
LITDVSLMHIYKLLLILGGICVVTRRSASTTGRPWAVARRHLLHITMAVLLHFFVGLSPTRRTRPVTKSTFVPFVRDLRRSAVHAAPRGVHH